MALYDDNSSGMVMPVAPAYGNNGGFGNGFGGDGWWILLLLLCGWGGFGGGFGGWGGAMGVDGLYPWLNNSEHISGGFRDQMLQSSVNSIGDKITSGFGDVATQLCGGFANVNSNITNASINNMQQLFGVQSALQQCCCDNRAGLADLKYTVATEECATRSASANNTRDIIDAQTRGTQAILDKLCALELDGYKREADNLRQQLNMAQLSASQTAQTAQILAGQASEIDGVYNRLKNCPVPSMPVYGNTPIFTCNSGCGCGCGA
ncbi:MAG: hypothetical protein II433_10100 [Acidaminococcaceae bacterium]|nr:hypothetical protein [Acidaminococcaceae bacterium]